MKTREKPKNCPACGARLKKYTPSFLAKLLPKSIKSGLQCMSCGKVICWPPPTKS